MASLTISQGEVGSQLALKSNGLGKSKGSGEHGPQRHWLSTDTSSSLRKADPKGRSALLADIQQGTRLRKVTQINDRSAPQIESSKGANKEGGGSVSSRGGSTPPALGDLFAGGFPVLRPAGQRDAAGTGGGKLNPPPAPPARSPTTELSSKSQQAPAWTPTPQPGSQMRNGSLHIIDDFESKFTFHSVEDFPPPDEYKPCQKIYPSKIPRSRTPGPWLQAEVAEQSSDDIKGRNSQEVPQRMVVPSSGEAVTSQLCCSVPAKTIGRTHSSCQPKLELEVTLSTPIPVSKFSSSPLQIPDPLESHMVEVPEANGRVPSKELGPEVESSPEVAPLLPVACPSEYPEPIAPTAQPKELLNGASSPPTADLSLVNASPQEEEMEEEEEEEEEQEEGREAEAKNEKGGEDLSLESPPVSATHPQIWRSVGATNLEEKKRYNQEFLLGFQFIFASMQKLERLPHITDVVLDKANKSPLWLLDPSRLPSINCDPDFTPSFANLGQPALSSRGPLRGGPVLMTECIKLNKAEKAWKPSSKQTADDNKWGEEDADGTETQDLFCRLCSILNKLTLQMFQQLMKQVTQLPSTLRTT
ncbi:Eukaryotic translation initiation factor 4 gamma 1 [Fukomys damarensis]|uniref:Eukaryotic translation initiation factor 4 gamma 1 n=1 Tax=Fukomys damarensis TaxID=885580 RepID=A0A091E8P8_FUKDA|nr:Eukaryotic translation initiation factor 4 gamma 1 [Fukomys damarensis]